MCVCICESLFTCTTHLSACSQVSQKVTLSTVLNKYGSRQLLHNTANKLHNMAMVATGNLLQQQDPLPKGLKTFFRLVV